MSDPTINGLCAIDPTVRFGENCTVWQNATICQETVIGNNVVVGSGVWIGRGCQIGDSTRIQHGAFIPNNTVVGRGVFIGPLAVLCDDKHPQAGRMYHPEPPTLEDDCSIGAGAVILPGVTIGHKTVIGAGAVVTQDMTTKRTYVGNPARQLLTHNGGM